MKCSDWRTEISALLDGSLVEHRAAEVRSHLESCSECSAFYAELSDLDRLLTDSLPTLDPPARVWSRIQLRIEDQARSPWWHMFRPLLSPRFAYGVAAAIVLFFLVITALDVRESSAEEERYLAELDSFTLEVEGNPFLPTIESGNPFFTYEDSSADNPFGRGRSIQR
jgi:anti-sigma factor RsiW